MTIPKAIGTVVSCGLVLGAVGGLLGIAIGSFFPAYYRSVFRGGNQPGFDPIAIGIGQGATQGIAGGILVGLIVVALLIWGERQASVAKRDRDNQKAVPERSPRSWGWIAILGGLGLLLCLGSCGIGSIIGFVSHDERHRQYQYLYEKEIVERALREDQFPSQLSIQQRSDGHITLGGSVATQVEFERLHELLTRKLGESLADEIVSGIGVREPHR